MSSGRIRSWSAALRPGDPATRSLAPIALVNTFGNGLFFTTSALYFTRVAGIGVSQLGVGLTLGGLCAVAASVPFGHAADRWGARRILAGIWLLEAAGMAAYTLVHDFLVFLPIVCLIVTLDRAATTVFRALLGEALPDPTRVRGRAYLRAVINIGLGCGAAAGALALVIDTRPAYVAMIVVNAATFVVATAMLARIPATTRPGTTRARSATPRAAAGPSGGPRPALGDLPYLAVTVLAALLAIQFSVLEIGLPLWIARDTSAPRATVAAIVVLNTALVVLLQVRLSRGTEDTRRAAALGRLAGVLLAVACAVYALTAGLPTWPAVAVLLLGAALQTVAEVYSSAGTTALSFELAPRERLGAYQGVFQAGYASGLLLAPLVITSTALRFGSTGWLALGGLFALAGAMLPIAAGRAAGRGAASDVANDQGLAGSEDASVGS